MAYRKEITPKYETIGKRRRLTGFLGEVFDGETRVSCLEYRNYSEAETQTDLLVYELLSDPMAYTATQMDGGADDPPEGPIILDEAPTDEPPWPLMRMPEGDILDADGMRVVKAPAYA